MQILLGLLLAAIVAYGAYRLHSLDRSGAFAATLVGTVIFGIGGLPWAILLLIFFITSSGLSRAFGIRKLGLSEKFSKGHERDAGQVLGNGGLAALFAGLHAVFPDSVLPWIGFAASLAAVNADTWATELGVLSPSPPRLITHLSKRVEKGTSGGISLWGTSASLLGAAVVALPAALLTDYRLLFPLTTLAGLAGSLFDSLLGATVQAMYFCPDDRKETEKHPLHSCGARTVHIRGWKWLNNDWVNFACSAFGAAVALILL